MLIEMTKAALPWKAITDKAGVTVWKENVRDTQHTRRHLLFADVPPEYQKMFALLEVRLRWVSLRRFDTPESHLL